MKTYRQGDVLIRAIKAVPKGAKDVTPKDRIVLAYGEVTGHAHAIAEGEAREFTMADAAGTVSRFLQSLGKYPAVEAPVVERIHNAFGEMLLLDMPSGQTLFAAADVVDAGATATPNAAWSKLSHEEHRPHGLLAGFYGINAPQREYTPEAIRNVAD